MNIAIIPARGGSKRIPGKNIREFAGKPIIGWPILAAQESGLFDHVIVSTDCAEIAEIARQHGAETPFMRPAELADDHTATIPVIAHAIRWAQAAGWPVKTACCIYATAPMIDTNELAAGLAKLNQSGKNFCFAATEFASPVFRAFRQSVNGGTEMLFPEHFATRSQDLPQIFHDAAQFYWGETTAWLSAERLFDENCIAHILPRWQVQDIDTPDDWYRAEALFHALKEPKT